MVAKGGSKILLPPFLAKYRGKSAIKQSFGSKIYQYIMQSKFCL